MRVQSEGRVKLLSTFKLVDFRAIFKGSPQFLPCLPPFHWHVKVLVFPSESITHRLKVAEQ